MTGPGQLHRPYTIAAIRRINQRTGTLLFREPLPAQPGQFAMAWLPGVDERPFSIAGADPLALTVAAVGPLSAALLQLPVGGRVWLRGPFGRGYRLAGKRLLLAGGGYGVAPLLFLAREAVAAGCQVEACIGARTAAEVLLVEELEELGTVVHVTTEDGSLGTAGLVTLAVEAAIQARRPDTVYACGPVKMLVAIDRQCEAHGLPRQLSWEAHMRCGIGLCGSCELTLPEPVSQPGPGWLVCLDGPVSFSH
jgi:dihydroorotate dehydrogenase electron transfer subunit